MSDTEYRCKDCYYWHPDRACDKWPYCDDYEFFRPREASE